MVSFIVVDRLFAGLIAQIEPTVRFGLQGGRRSRRGRIDHARLGRRPGAATNVRRADNGRIAFRRIVVVRIAQRQIDLQTERTLRSVHSRSNGCSLTECSMLAVVDVASVNIWPELGGDEMTSVRTWV